MLSIADIATFLERFAPTALAEAWDNVGLLVGDRRQGVSRVMTCLTITHASAAEAIARQAELIVSHHPLPFRPFKRLTADTAEGRLLLDLIGAGVSIYSPHTAFDSAAAGINQRLAEGLGLTAIAPLTPIERGDIPPSLGAGRYGQLDSPVPLAAFVERVKRFLKLDHLQVAGSATRAIQRPAVACGSAGDLFAAAIAAGCDCIVTGEARFHACLDAEAQGIALILTGHFASERFGVEALAEILATEFPQLEVWASGQECDPLSWY